MRPDSLRTLVATLGALCVWLGASGAFAQDPEPRWLDIDRSRVTLRILGPDGSEALIIDAPLTEGSVEETEPPHLALVIDVAGLRVVEDEPTADQGQAVLDRLIGPNGLNGERYTRVTYHSLTIEEPGQNVWVIRGELEMNGRFLPLDARAVRDGDRFTGSARLVPADFGVMPMPLGPDDGPVGQAVEVEFDVVLEPR